MLFSLVEGRLNVGCGVECILFCQSSAINAHLFIRILFFQRYVPRKLYSEEDRVCEGKPYRCCCEVCCL